MNNEMKAISPSELIDSGIVIENDLDAIVYHINECIKNRSLSLNVNGSFLVPLHENVLWTKDFKLYDNKENLEKLCDIYEAAGWSCRYGPQAYWEYTQGEQGYFFELSYKVKYDHRDARDYRKELKQGKN